MRVSRPVSLLAASGLIASGLVVAAASAPSLAAPGSGWCTDDAPPCIESASRNGVAVLESDANWDVQITYPWIAPDEQYEEFGWAVVPHGVNEHALTDEWVVVLNTGDKEPETLKARAGVPEFRRYFEDGSWHVEITGKPVRWVVGCNSEAEWPWPCQETATDEDIVLDGDLHRHHDVSFDWLEDFVFSASAIYNGIFLADDEKGNKYLETEMVAPHYRTDGTTVFVAQARFRIPYPTLVDMGIPDPVTLVPSSLSGTVNGSATGATFAVTNDRAVRAMIVDISGITFSRKRIRVQAGNIKPTRPRIIKAVRVSGGKGRVVFSKANPRGARVKGYTARCSRKGHTVTVQGTYDRIVMRGLTPGKTYKCQVRAKSKAGPSRWSRAKRL